MLLNTDGIRNTAVGAAALLNNQGDTTNNGAFNGAFGTQALNANTLGFSNNAVGDQALFNNQTAAANTAVGDQALLTNDSSGAGDANNNVAVGAQALVNNFSGSENTAVGTGVGPNIVTGFNNNYIGNFVGTCVDIACSGPVPNESDTIRIGDLSENGFGSAACFIGGIFNNPQPVGGNVVVVTLNLDTDQLGFQPNAGNAPGAPHRNAPQPRVRPQPQHSDGLNGRVGKVEKLEATVAQQQKQIDTLTAQLREQAAQIQKVSAQLEIIRPTPRVVENR
jgi:hypothetical protein